MPMGCNWSLLLSLVLSLLTLVSAAAIPKVADEEVPYQVVNLIFWKQNSLYYYQVQGLDYKIKVNAFSGYVESPKDPIYKLKFVAHLLGVEEFNSKDPSTFTKLFLFKKAIGFPFDNYAPIEIDYYSWSRGTYLALNRFCSQVKTETVIEIPPWDKLSPDVQREVTNAYRRAFKVSFNAPSYRPLMITIINRSYYSSGELRETEPQNEPPPVRSPEKEMRPRQSLPPVSGGNPVIVVGRERTQGEKKPLLNLNKSKLITIIVAFLLVIGVAFLILKPKQPPQPVVPKPITSEKLASQLLKTAQYNQSISAQGIPSRGGADEEVIKSLVKKIDDLFVQLNELREQLNELRGKQEELRKELSALNPSNRERGITSSKSDSINVSAEQRKEVVEPHIPPSARDSKESLDMERLDAFIFQLEKIENLVKQALRSLERHFDNGKLALIKADVISKISGLKEYVRTHRKINLSRFDEIIKRDVFSIIEMIDKIELEEGLDTELSAIRRDLLKASGIAEIPIVVGKTRVNVMEHKVVDAIYSDEHPEGIILEVVERGYRYKGKVIKRAKVVEAKRGLS